MKHTKLMAMATLLLLGVSGLGVSGLMIGVAAAQSLGDYARTVRKNKPEPNPATRHYDNDNLPTGEGLSVVGPPPSSDANPDNSKTAAAAPAPSPAEQKKTADEWQKKLDDQKQKVDALNHELDIDQREVRLRTAAAYTDPNIAVRDVQWNKDDARYKSEIEGKQKALDAARQQLDDMQEQAHKAGAVGNGNNNDKDKDSDNTTKDQDKDTDRDRDKDKDKNQD